MDPTRFRTKGPVFFDIGARFGEVGLSLLEEFGGKVFAYEPSIAGDKIPERAGLMLRRQAIWDHCALIDFCDCVDQPVSSSVYERKPRRGRAVFRQVESITLDIAFRGLSWIDFINMDIEGAEWDILDSDAISQLLIVDQMCIEFHTEFSGGRSLDYIMKRLSALAAFDCEIVEQARTRRPIVWCVKREMSLRIESNAWLRGLLRGKHFGRVLNLGCGSDKDFEGDVYSNYFGADEVVRVDILDRHGVADVVVSSEDLPFPDNSFDFVFANWMIYKTDVLRSLEEIVRVLRPGGKVLLSYSVKDMGFVKNITATIKSLFDVESEFGFDNVVKRSHRRAEAVYGTVRSDASAHFELDFVLPVLVVVAHWDDEAISLGGILSRYGKGWVVVSATHRDQETTYRGIFEQIGVEIGYEAVTLDIRQRERPMVAGEDRHFYARGVPRVLLNREVVEPALCEKLGDLSRFKTVITHCTTGDYGTHPQHKELAAAVTSIFARTASVWSFNLKVGTVRFSFSPEERREKLALIRRYKPNFRKEMVPENEYLIWAK